MQELAEPAQAFSVDSAAALLGKSMSSAEIARSSDGKFTSKTSPETAETPVDDPAKVIDLKTGKPAEVAKVEEDDEDLEFELPPEKEGEEAKRLKLSQLYEGYEKAAKLEAEIEQVRSQVKTVPAEYQTQIQETVQARAKYLEGLEMMERMVNPRQPSLDMMDPNSPKYDPDGYYAAARKFEQDRELIGAIRADRAKVSKAQEEQQSILAKAHVAREMESLNRAWPESKDPAALKRLADSLINDYGFSNEEIENISDHRQLLVVRDALELRALKAKQADAVKVVRAKPKLVKGAARSSTDPKATARSNAMSRLTATGSMDAAAEVIKGLLK
jgi:hypothetical protein